jgi:hypothetical protein
VTDLCSEGQEIGLAQHQVFEFRAAVPLAPACEVNDVHHRMLSTVPLKGETVEPYFVQLCAPRWLIRVRFPCPARTIRNKTTCWLHCPRRNANDCTPTCGSSRCRSGASCTSQAMSCATCIFRPTPLYPCCTSSPTARRRKFRWSARKASSASRCSWAVNHPQPGHRAKRRPRLPADRPAAQGRVSSKWGTADSAAALHAGPDHADGADRGVQSPPLGGPATVPLAAAVSRSSVSQPIDHDAGTDRQYARRAP